MFEGSEGNKMLLGGKKMFSVQVIKELYRHSTKFVHNISCSGVGLTQNNVARMEMEMIFFLQCLHSQLTLRGVAIDSEPKATVLALYN